MKLPDIKKLKVAELRTRLQELGLDSRGLKAELVERLRAALEPAESPGRGDEADGTRQDDGSPTPLTPAEAVGAAAAAAPLPPEPSRTTHFSDTSTQTEPDHDPHDPRFEPPMVTDAESGFRAPGGGGEHPGGDRGRAFYEFKEEIRYKRAKSPQPPMQSEDLREEDEDAVRLDQHVGHVHFEVGVDGACGQPRFWDRYPLLWSGCRLSHGVTRGRVGFEARLERKLPSTRVEDAEPCGMRIGWSVAGTSLLLGEDDCSFAFDCRGKRVSAQKEEEFGEPFSEGDIIGCFASFSSDGAVQLSFSKNGHFVGVAFSLDASVLRGRALFPHVLCKNCSVRFLLDPTAPTWYPPPAGITPLVSLPAGQRVRASPGPISRAQSEVVLMVGLPGSGKSHWARTHMKQHPEKHYRLLGTEELLACMMSGGQKDSRLRQASQCLTDLIKMAAQTPGNYILDQYNTFFSAQRHKLQLFAGFRRRVVVVVFPPAEEWKRRLSEHQERQGEQIPDTALLKLQVSCSLPEQEGDLLEELRFVELPRDAAQTLLQEYKEEARRLLPPVPKQEKKHRFHKKRPHPHGPPPTHFIRWTGRHGWNDTRHAAQILECGGAGSRLFHWM